METLITLLEASAVLLLVAGFFLRRRRADMKTRNEDPVAGLEDSDSFKDYNKEFLEICADKKTVKMAKTYNQNDISLIQSMLRSEGIASYSEFENMNSLFPGVAVSGYTDSYIHVLEEDRDDARVIIKGYIDELAATRTESAAGKLRNIAEFAVGGYAIPRDGSRMLPELLV
jgi:hypothetical protein